MWVGGDGSACGRCSGRKPGATWSGATRDRTEEGGGGEALGGGVFGGEEVVEGVEGGLTAGFIAAAGVEGLELAEGFEGLLDGRD